jgi:hypothetical protein
MSVVTQLCFKIVEENNYMFRPFSGWVIIRLRLEYRRTLIYYYATKSYKCTLRSIIGQPHTTHTGKTPPPMKPTQPRTDSSPRVDEPTEDTTNKAVTIAHSTPCIYSYTPPQKV